MFNFIVSNAGNVTAAVLVNDEGLALTGEAYLIRFFAGVNATRILGRVFLDDIRIRNTLSIYAHDSKGVFDLHSHVQDKVCCDLEMGTHDLG